MDTFLLVDDDEAFTTVLARALTRLGHKVNTAHDVDSAGALARQQPLSKAVVDLKMEGPSGLTLIPALKDLHPNIEIVVLTGYSSVVTAVDAIKLGAVNYLCKPANTSEILAAFTTQPDMASASIAQAPPSVERLEWEHIQKVLADNEGNISATARALGMHRRTLQRKLQKRPVQK